jgi:plasmid stabilization system protein ParE
MAEVVWTKKALSQLEHAIKYVREESGITYAEILLNGILNATRHLERYPQSGQKELFLAHKKSEYRYTVAWSYKIVYRITASKVTISRVFHTAQHPTKILD